MESPEQLARQAAILRRRAEELVAGEVLAHMLADCPDPSAGDKLAASHYAQSSSTSPQALAARLWR